MLQSLRKRTVNGFEEYVCMRANANILDVPDARLRNYD
jgi:hypothetical protein